MNPTRQAASSAPDPTTARARTPTAPDAAPADVSAERVRANMYFLVAEVFLFGLALPATARFLPVYAIRLDASAAMLGWLTALPAIIAMITSAFAEWWRRKCGSLERAALLAGFGFRIMFLLPAFTPFFPAEWQTVWLLVAVSLPAVAQGVSAVVFLVLLRSGLPDNRVTAVVSRRATLFNAGVAVGTVALGFWLEQAPFPLNYQVMFVAAFVLALVSLEHVRRVHVLDDVPAPAAQPDPGQALALPGVRRVMIVTMLTHVTFFMVVPIIPLRLVNELGAAEGFMSVFALAELSAAAIMASQTNRLVRRWGSLNVIAVGMVGTALAALIIGLTENLAVALVGSALSGATWTAAAVSVFGYFTENTSQANVTRFTRIFNQVVMLSIFVGPLLGSQLASTSLTLTTVLLIGAGVRLAAGVWVLASQHRDMVRRPRPAAA